MNLDLGRHFEGLGTVTRHRGMWNEEFCTVSGRSGRRVSVSYAVPEDPNSEYPGHFLVSHTDRSPLERFASKWRDFSKKLTDGFRKNVLAEPLLRLPRNPTHNLGNMESYADFERAKNSVHGRLGLNAV